MQAKPLDKATFGYDFRETSSASHESVVKKVKKSDISTTFDHKGATASCFVPFRGVHVFLGACVNGAQFN